MPGPPHASAVILNEQEIYSNQRSGTTLDEPRAIEREANVNDKQAFEFLVPELETATLAAENADDAETDVALGRGLVRRAKKVSITRHELAEVWRTSVV